MRCRDMTAVPILRRTDPGVVIWSLSAMLMVGTTLLPIPPASAAEEKEPPSEVRLAGEAKRLLRAPLVVCVVSRVVENPAAPEWEQVLSAGAACFSMCLAANAMGYGTAWVTEWIAYSPRVKAALGLAANERVAGFVYMGTATETQPDRERPALADIVTYHGQASGR